MKLDVACRDFFDDHDVGKFLVKCQAEMLNPFAYMIEIKSMQEFIKYDQVNSTLLFHKPTVTPKNLTLLNVSECIGIAHKNKFNKGLEHLTYRNWLKLNSLLNTIILMKTSSISHLLIEQMIDWEGL